ncbi:MAG: nucleoside 2-deoxyribosyltransferase [Ignavibacteria bacterium]|nr:nucleoside 2-deoxyribosyltransferase [Ignavibacteria bacterium]
MKIYFAGSIRGGRDDADLYSEIIKHLKQYGEVLTEHIGDKALEVLGENTMNDTYIHNRDLKWILQSDIVVAEVTTPSLGVGYEIGRAIENNKRVLCLYRSKSGKKLSAMIAGSPDIAIEEYKTLDEAREIIDNHFKKE